MKTTVIYHRADFDGIFCREIARKFLPEANLIGWHYGDPIPEIPQDVRLYMLDISIEQLMDHPNLIWIDHHKSAIDKWGNLPRRGFMLDGVAACRLTWQYLNNRDPQDGRLLDLPNKQQFIDRTVSEPLAVRLAGEYDIWDKRDPRAELFQHGLRSRDLTPEIWMELLQPNHLDPCLNSPMVSGLLEAGKSIEYAQTKQNESIIKDLGFDLEFEGLKFLACNHARYNSHLFTAGLKPEHDACFGFKWLGQKGCWEISLYHAPGKEHHDLSLIAVKYGGGGHRGACGFRMKELPFLK